jgi:hypothetical protein
MSQLVHARDRWHEAGSRGSLPAARGSFSHKSPRVKVPPIWRRAKGENCQGANHLAPDRGRGDTRGAAIPGSGDTGERRYRERRYRGEAIPRPMPRRRGGWPEPFGGDGDGRCGSVGAANVSADRAARHAVAWIELEIARAAIRGAVEMGAGRGTAAESAHGRRTPGHGRLGGTGHHGWFRYYFLARRDRGVGDQLRGRGSFRCLFSGLGAIYLASRVVTGSEDWAL